jgi:uncharacterized protein YuzB (UPF0349 family)
MCIELCIFLGYTLILFVLFITIAMGTDLVLWKLQSIPNNVVLGYYCRTYQNNLSQSKFFVACVLSIMATEKINVMLSKECFEGLLKYYVKIV